jgi:hypothetical protein
MKKLLFLYLAVCSLAFSQGVRYDPVPVLTTAGNVPPGAMAPVLAIGGSKIHVCGFPANAVPCTNYATTYTDVTLTTACANTAQITLPGTTQCVSSTDQQGNFGFWVFPGEYAYTITIPSGQSYGPYPIMTVNSGSQISYITPPVAAGAVARTANGKMADITSVKDFGAKGDGSTDDTSDIQAAINYAILTGNALYFPAGTYITSAMLTAYGANKDINIIGQSEFHTILYCKNCTGTQEAVLRVASDASASEFLGSVNIKDLTIWGTTATTYALELNNPTWGTLNSVAPGPAVQACLYVSGGVGMTYQNVLVDSNHTGGWIGNMHPRVGFELDASSLTVSTTSTVVSPTIQGMNSGDGAIGLYLKGAGAIVVTGEQLTENDINLQIDGASANNTIMGGLLENVGGAGATIISGGKNTFINNLWTGGPVTISAQNTFMSNQFASPVTINAGTTSGSIFNGNQLLNSGLFTDNAGDTIFSNNSTYGESGIPVYNFPAVQNVLTLPTSRFGAAAPYSPVVLEGTWEVSTAAAPAIISPRTFATGKSWKMLLIGSPLASGSPILHGGATMVELNETSNVLTLGSGFSVTFSINSSGQLQMAEAADGGPIGFSGTIVFMPSQFTAGTDTSLSTDFARVSKSAGFQLKSTTQPTCNVGNAGLSWYVQGNSTTQDSVQICTHDSANTYRWGSFVLNQQSLPTIAAGAGSGTSPTISISSYSTSASGTINITTGASPASGATIATVTFATALNKTAGCVISPSVSSAIATPIGVALDSSAGFSLVSGNTALTAATTYQWNYVCL